MTLVKQFADNPASLAAYHEWRRLPMTQIMLDFCRIQAEPLGLPGVNQTGEGALYYAGRIDGGYAILNLLSNLPQQVEMHTTIARAQGMLKETTYTGENTERA